MQVVDLSSMQKRAEYISDEALKVSKILEQAMVVAIGDHNNDQVLAVCIYLTAARHFLTTTSRSIHKLTGKMPVFVDVKSGKEVDNG